MTMQEKQQFNLPEEEEKILKFWEERKIFKKSLDKNRRGKAFVFYEGPPTANGAPGIHHVEARAFKDIICRYKTMRGFYVPRKAGWDTHGLPVEIQVEKELGFKTKQEIEKYGIARFNAKAKESVWRYKEEWERLSKRMGYWIDLEHPYITYETAYIEKLWGIIKDFWNKGLLYEDFKVVPWCPRCQTGLSSHEVGQGYKEVEDTAVYVKFKIQNEKGKSTIQNSKLKEIAKDNRPTYILSWTTTPWTLPGNAALAVGENIEYVMAEAGEERVILAASRLAAVAPNGRIVKTLSARELIGLRYEPLFTVRELETDASHRVYAAPFVSDAEGTGVVHTAVMYGEDDYRLGSEVGLPKFHTVSEDGKFLADLKDLGGMAVKDRAAEERILKILAEKNLLFKKEKYRHEYPHCWRCETPLLYYARKAWWVKTTAVKKELLAGNQKINWIPGHIKNGRFGEFLRDLRDWAFSRERYWGTPLPVWKCGECGVIEVIGSLEELEKRAGRLPRDENNEVNLHRPYVDDIQLECEKCGGVMRRTPEVADVWFDSGAMPFASQNPKPKTQNPLYPADYICEAVDQTRGWFYTLLAVATLLGRGAPYKNAISLGHVLDKNGQKMSKSKGNAVNPWVMMQKYGADALRWYFYTVNAPGEPKLFDEKEVELRRRGFVATLWNSFVFFDMYVDKVKSQSPIKSGTKVKTSENILDRWVMVRMDALIRHVTEKFEAYDVAGAARSLEEFAVNDFSQWYIRHSRRRLQHPEAAREKNEAAATLGFVLAVLARLAAPATPFLAESLWLGLRKKMGLKEESVHLASWPLAEKKISIRETRLLKDMELLREKTAEFLRIRAEARIQLRQPLRAAYTKGKMTAEWNELLKKTANVKEVISGDEWKLDTEVTPELREEGIVRELIRTVQEMRRDLGLKPKEVIRLQVMGESGIEALAGRRDTFIKKETNADELKVGGEKLFRAEREFEFGGGTLWVGIQ